MEIILYCDPKDSLLLLPSLFCFCALTGVPRDPFGKITALRGWQPGPSILHCDPNDNLLLLLSII